MNFDELQQSWNSPRNDLALEERRNLVDQFTRRMLRQRRFRTGWLICTFALLLVATGIALRTVAIGKANLELEWGLFPLLIVPWLFAFHFLRRHLKEASILTPGEVPVTEALHRAMASNRVEQSHLKKVGLMFGIMIPLLSLSVYQLYSAHKVSERELVSMVIFFGGILSLSGVGILARYFGRVLPAQRQLNDLLNELVGEPPR